MNLFWFILLETTEEGSVMIYVLICFSFKSVRTLEDKKQGWI